MTAVIFTVSLVTAVAAAMIFAVTFIATFVATADGNPHKIYGGYKQQKVKGKKGLT